MRTQLGAHVPELLGVVVGGQCARASRVNPADESSVVEDELRT